MVQSVVRSKRQGGVVDVVGKGLLLGLVIGASALTHASPVTSNAIYIDDNSCSNGASARHGGSRPGCSGQLVEYFGESGGSPGFAMASFQAPSVAVASVASVTPQILGSKPAPQAVTPVVSAPLAVVQPVVPTQQIVAAAPPVAPTNTATPTNTAAPAAPTTGGTGGSLPAIPSLAVLSVPEPSTLALMLGGFIALIGIRRSRSASKK